ncbi:MAG: hypothetical protein WD689_05160 [Gaiellaceae bacterium]
MLELSTERFVFALVLGTILSLLVFRHAEQHGNQRATAWGIATFFFGAFAVALYFWRYFTRRVKT